MFVCFQQDVEVGIPVLPYARQESCALAVKFTASQPWTYLPSVEYSDVSTMELIPKPDFNYFVYS